MYTDKMTNRIADTSAKSSLVSYTRQAGLYYDCSFMLAYNKGQR